MGPDGQGVPFNLGDGIHHNEMPAEDWLTEHANDFQTELWMDLVFLYHALFVQGVTPASSVTESAVRGMCKMIRAVGAEVPATPEAFYTMVAEVSTHLEKQDLDNFFSSQLGASNDN